MSKKILEMQQKAEVMENLKFQIRDLKYFWVPEKARSLNVTTHMMTKVAKQAGFYIALLNGKNFAHKLEFAREAAEYLNDEH